jgi:uncharacterized protein
MSVAPSVWLLSDGKAGHETPLTGVAEALGARFELRRVGSRAVFAALAPFGPIDPRHRGGKGPLAGPYPDICMASGRRTVPYLRALKALSPGTFCVYFKDPRTRRSGADVLVVMEHDDLQGPNILTTKTAPHRLSQAVLRDARADPNPTLAALATPRVAVLIGGDSRHHRFSEANIRALMGHLKTLHRGGASLMITVSRRTPLTLQDQVFALRSLNNVEVWDGRDPNPLAQYLALADAVIVTADSINMVGEAAATGQPVHLFHPTGSHAKFDAFQAGLAKIATLRNLDGTLAGARYHPIDSTGDVAAQIHQRYGQFRAQNDGTSKA